MRKMVLCLSKSSGGTNDDADAMCTIRHVFEASTAVVAAKQLLEIMVCQNMHLFT